MPQIVFTSKGAAEALSAQEKLNQKARDLKAIYRDEAVAASDLEKAIKRIYANAKNPAEQYNKEMGRLLAAFRDGKINAEQYEKALAKLADAHEDVSSVSGQLKSKTDKLFSAETLTKVGKFALGLGGVSSAAALITQELRAQLELIDKAAKTQLSVSQSRNVVLRNLVGTSPENARAILEENQKLASETGVSEQAINQARASALSASGGNVQASLEATRVAAKFLADQPGEIGGFAGSLLDLSKVTGSTDANENLGLLSFVASQSRVVSPQQQAANIPRALIGARSFGATSQEAAALFASITTGSGDLTGATSGTATIQLAKQLESFQVPGATTVSEKIAAMQSNPELASSFLADASFETSSLGPIRELLSNPNSEIARSFQSGMSALPDSAGLRRQGQSAIDLFNQANSLNPLAVADRNLGTLTETLRVGETQNLSDEARENLREILMRTGSGSLSARGRSLLGSLSDGELGMSVEETRDILQGEAERLGRPTRFTSGGSGGSGGASPFVFEKPAPKEELEQAEALKQVVKLLTDALDVQRDSNRKLDETGGIATGAD